MKAINEATRIPLLPISGLVHSSDLIYADGPLLSHYIHHRGDSYLYYWCDCDESGNRWMVLRVSEFDVLQLIYRIVPLSFVVPKGCLDDFVYFIDVESSSTSTWMCPVRRVPIDYVPSHGAYLDVDCAGSTATYSVLLDGEISPQDLFRLPRLMELLYSFQYAMEVLGVDKVERFPWKNGFSSGQFDGWIAKTIPYPDRLGVDRLQVASPGFVRFHAKHDIFDSIAKAIMHCIGKKDAINKADRLLLDWISDKYTGDSRPDHTPEYPTADSNRKKVLDEQLLKRLEHFLATFDSLPIHTVMSATQDPFEAAQVSRWYFRRVKELAKAVESGEVKLPPLRNA